MELQALYEEYWIRQKGMFLIDYWVQMNYEAYSPFQIVNFWILDACQQVVCKHK